jgi:signal transduction histidine kinase
MKFMQRLLFAGFIISFLLVGALAAVSFIQTNRLAGRVKLVEHTYIAVSTIDSITYELLSTDKSAFRFTAVRDSGFFRSFNAAAERIFEITLRLKELISDNEKQRNNAVELQSSEAVYINDCKRLFVQPVMPIDELVNSTAYKDNLAKMQMAIDKLREMADNEKGLLKTRTVERENYLHATTSMLRTWSVIFGGLTLLLFVLLLYQFRRRVQYQEELQQKIAEIGQSKRELEHIAYATSHDLQEPLRKIRILTDRWQNTFKRNLTPEGNAMLERVVSSAARMQDLVAELMMLSTLNSDTKRVNCQVREYVDAAIEQLSNSINEKQAKLIVGELPTVLGYPDQMKLLFRHLIDNALKFSKPGRQIQIDITSRMAGIEELSPQHRSDKQYYCISIEDNGIGFNNRQAEKMFGIFRQLHSAQDGYLGKGIGLAVCQRIMNNHQGHIVAHGFPDEGAMFKLYFPV